MQEKNVRLLHSSIPSKRANNNFVQRRMKKLMNDNQKFKDLYQQRYFILKLIALLQETQFENGQGGYDDEE